ncbi:MBL fold metallo-hydrolase [Angustibacter sp. Root456]|uniref:MBL fold metallo-hydrolase n=1 Tax=Angustibacter sp. Root456 TaxID=1736539 RepID=UPI0006FE996B|nr:MBL fold metallo-hydrolase [Angustibacter sp. Root456]KQX61660.1 MBL fold metallo-hydrolase [Angustibacter sp. Root456]
MTAAWPGGAVGRRARCVLAPNPSPMTLDGTNTWVLLEPGAQRAVVVDPGPDDPAHLEAVLGVVREAGAVVAMTLLTHGHLDHSGGARRFHELTGAPVLALDPLQRLGSEGLAQGQQLDVDGLALEVVATPGHTSDSLSFLLPADAAVLTGDTVLGRGTTVVAHPDGRLADYLESLRRLGSLARDGRIGTVLPGHGPALDDATTVIDRYLAHRGQRLEQVRAAVAGGATTARRVVEVVYADVDRSLWPAAELSVRAQLDYLSDPS